MIVIIFFHLHILILENRKVKLQNFIMKLPEMKVYANKVKEYWPRSLMYQHDRNNICYFKIE